MADDVGNQAGGGEQAADISNAVVKLFSEYYGRGPTRSKTYIYDDFVTCVLQDTMTTVERTLVACGRRDLVREVRLTFQTEMADSFTSAVQRITGRKVINYQSQITFDPEYCFEVFVLEPPGGGDPGP
jgi:uncharacterized protein YbcI